MRALYDVGGVSRLFTVADVTIVGAAILGGVGFGVNEFLRRFFTEAAGGPGTAALYAIQITIGASLTSQVLSSILVCPPRSSASAPSPPRSRRSPRAAAKARRAAAAAARSSAPTRCCRALLTLWAEGGLGVLYAPLLPLLLREFPFTVAKFLARRRVAGDHRRRPRLAGDARRRRRRRASRRLPRRHRRRRRLQPRRRDPHPRGPAAAAGRQGRRRR